MSYLDNEIGRCTCCGDPVPRETLDKGICAYCRDEHAGRANYSASWPRIRQSRAPYAGNLCHVESNTPLGAMLEKVGQ